MSLTFKKIKDQLTISVLLDVRVDNIAAIFSIANSSSREASSCCKRTQL